MSFGCDAFRPPGGNEDMIGGGGGQLRHIRQLIELMELITICPNHNAEWRYFLTVCNPLPVVLSIQKPICVIRIGNLVRTCQLLVNLRMVDLNVPVWTIT